MNEGSDGADVTSGDSPFQTRAATTGKARSPTVVRHVGGTMSVDVEAVTVAAVVSRCRRRDEALRRGTKAPSHVDSGILKHKVRGHGHEINMLLSASVLSGLMSPESNDVESSSLVHRYL